MIERLMNLERPYGKSEYRKLSEKIVQLKQQLCGQLSPQGKDQLEELADIYLEQNAILLENRFIEGFCAAIDLAQDYLEHTTADPQQPPES